MAWEGGEMRHLSPHSLARRDEQLVEGMLEVFQPHPTYFESRKVQGVQRWLESGLGRFYITAPEVLLPQLVTRESLSDHAPVRMRVSIHRVTPIGKRPISRMAHQDGAVSCRGTRPPGQVGCDGAPAWGPMTTSETSSAKRVTSSHAHPHAVTGEGCAGAASGPPSVGSRLGAARCGRRQGSSQGASMPDFDGQCSRFWGK